MESRLIFLHRYGMFLQEGRRRVADPGWWNARFKPVGGAARRPRATNSSSIRREVKRRDLWSHELGDPMLPRKAPVESTAVVTVPQTDTGGRGEYPKALERTLLKELGKMTP
jgi:hypothetical protein